jgi:hypothetical protein
VTPVPPIALFSVALEDEVDGTGIVEVTFVGINKEASCFVSMIDDFLLALSLAPPEDCCERKSVREKEGKRERG